MFTHSVEKSFLEMWNHTVRDILIFTLIYHYILDCLSLFIMLFLEMIFMADLMYLLDKIILVLLMS